MNELLTLSVTELAKRIKEGDISPVELTETHIRRIEAVNPKINAVIVPTFDQAMDEARAAQEKLASMKDKANELPPYFGVPCTIKDTLAIKGLVWAVGSHYRRNIIAGEDATIVTRMKDAGFIIMGKTNVPEGAMWIESYNKVYGRTKNPYDTSRGVGGSSGGEGAIVAAGGSPIGIGSDIGGSIRYPACFNGVPGHKSTGGLVPYTGSWPPPEGGIARYHTSGPLARRVEDLMPMLKLLAGSDGKDNSIEDRPLSDPDKVDLKGLRVFYYTDIRIAKANHDVKRAIMMSAQALEDRGCIVEHWRPEGIERGMEMWSAALAVNSEKPFEEYIFESGGSYWPELLKSFIGKSNVTAPSLSLILTEKIGEALFRKQLEKSAASVPKLQHRIEEKLGDNGILLCPAYATPAPKHSAPWLRLPAVGFSSVYNVLEFPGTVLPVRYTSDGLPVSVQLVGARMSDHLTIAAAKALEEEFGGWRIAPVG